jgi:DNA-binding ferritin-like protein
MGPIIELITSYENRIATVEELMTKAYQATMAPEGSLDLLDEKREQLKTDLQKTLARHCSLRKKDFDRLLEKVLSDSTSKRDMIEQERKQVRERVTKYLEEHKQLADYLRKQLVELAEEAADNGTLNAMIGIIRTRYEDTSQKLFAALREFQTRLDVFRREQEDINSRLQRLADRGESLRIEDLRQLEAARADQERKADRGLRREVVDRLLAHFRQQRLENRCS